MTITPKKNSNGEVYGFWVRWDHSGDHRPKYQGNFNIKDYGSIESAKIAAEAFKAGLRLATNYCDDRSHVNYSKPNKVSRTEIGIPGVHFVRKVRKTKAGSVYIQEYFVASWQEKKYKQRTKQFGLVKHGGYVKTMKKAIEHRNKMIKKYNKE